MKLGRAPRHLFYPRSDLMPQRYYEYAIRFRPWRKGRNGPRIPASPVRMVRIVARTKFDAEWAFKGKHPQMTIISCERGKQVPPPARPG